MSKPWSVNRFVSASSSSGFDAGFVARMSSSGSTSPRPKKCFQVRFTNDRAKNGLSGDVSQSASCSRGSSLASIVSGVPPRPAGVSWSPDFGCLAVATPVLWKIRCSASLSPGFLPSCVKNAENRA